LACDAITVSPYLGFGALDPFFSTARRFGAGVFVLGLTSNAEGPEVQSARVDTGETVAERMLAHLRRLNGATAPIGPFGAVIGATISPAAQSAVADQLDFNGPVLVPGLGEQGGTAADIRRIFGALTVLPSSSRGLLRSGPSARSLGQAARRVNQELA
jgi:orotidine-5'-phosphate decarboxylase